jgi:hypothetical protein
MAELADALDSKSGGRKKLPFMAERHSTRLAQADIFLLISGRQISEYDLRFFDAATASQAVKR